MIISIGKWRAHDRYLVHWIGLTLIFALMSLDEAMSVHEMTTPVVRNALGTTGAFYFAWVIPAIAFMAVFVVVYLRFTLALPKRTMHLFVTAGIVYLSGVLGIEMIGSAYSYEYGKTVSYGIIATIEEVFEMFGIVIFVYALLDYLEAHAVSLEIRFGKGSGPASLRKKLGVRR